MLKMISRLIFAAILALASPAFATVMPAVNSSPGLGGAVLTTKAVNLGTTGDQGTVAIPSWLALYQIESIRVSNCSAIPVLAQAAIYTASGGGGTNMVAATTITGATSAGVVLPLTLAGTSATTTFSAATLYVRVAVANTAPLTCDFQFQLSDWD